MIIGGISLDEDDSIVSIRMNWRIQLEIVETLEAFTPQSTRDSDRERAIAPSGSGRLPKAKGEYWSHSIAKWLIQRASPFWNTIRSGGTFTMGMSAYIAGKVYQATLGRVVKFVAKQSLRQMVIRPALGGASLTAAYFVGVGILAHDIYVLLENKAAKTKWLGEGLDMGGGAGGFGA